MPFINLGRNSTTVGFRKKRSVFFAPLVQGYLFGWGRNNSGQLGLNNTTNYSSPVQVGSLITWSAIECGDVSTYAIKTDGTLWSWGFNSEGGLGQGNITNYSSPKQIGALTSWSKISGGALHGVAIKIDGTLWAWGSNQAGQVGDGTILDRSSPVQIGTSSWTAVSAGTYHTVGLMKVSA